ARGRDHQGPRRRRRRLRDQTVRLPGPRGPGAAAARGGAVNPARLGGLAAVVLAPAVVVAAVGTAIFFSAPPTDRAVLARVLREQAAFLAVAAVLVTLVAGLLIAAALRRYVAPARRLAADVRVVLDANPEHRVPPSGPAEL